MLKENFHIFQYIKVKEDKCVLQDRVVTKCNAHIKAMRAPSYIIALEEMLKNIKTGYLLCVGEKVFLPKDIVDYCDKVVTMANRQCGEEGWVFIGNRGVSHYNNEDTAYEPLGLLHNAKNYMDLASYLDPNVVLINVAVVKKYRIIDEVVGISPDTAPGAMLLMIAEGYQRSAASLLSVHLFCVNRHRPYTTEDIHHDKHFLKFWEDTYINHTVRIYGEALFLKTSLRYLIHSKKTLQQRDFYASIHDTFKKQQEGKSIPKINILIRTQIKNENFIKRILDSLRTAKANCCVDLRYSVTFIVNNVIGDPQNFESLLKKEYQDLNVSTLYFDVSENYYPRVEALKRGSEEVPDEELIWFIDDDDFIFPEAFNSIFYFYKEDHILIANSAVFNETWDGYGSAPLSKFKKIYHARDYCKVLSGNNFTPICSILYPAFVVKEIFCERRLSDDYAEDYALLLYALFKKDVIVIEQVIAGISIHGKNTVIEKSRDNWDYSYATFIAEVVESGIVQKINYDYSKHLQIEIAQKDAMTTHIKSSLELEMATMKKSFFWKLRIVYMKIKHWLIFIFLNPKKFLRSLFKEGKS